MALSPQEQAEFDRIVSGAKPQPEKKKPGVLDRVIGVGKQIVKDEVKGFVDAGQTIKDLAVGIPRATTRAAAGVAADVLTDKKGFAPSNAVEKFAFGNEYVPSYTERVNNFVATGRNAAEGVGIESNLGKSLAGAVGGALAPVVATSEIIPVIPATAAAKASQAVKPVLDDAVKVAGKAADAVVESVDVAVKARQARYAAQNAEKLDNIANQVIQGAGDTYKVNQAKKAISLIDTEGVKTYSDLASRLDDHISAVSKNLDDILGSDTNVYKLDDLYNVKTVGVDKLPVKHNYVEDALSGLEELYLKTNEPDNLALIRQLTEKAKTKGLTIQELNKLAIKYGQEFDTKAFSKIGEPLTSVTAQATENTRKGLKATARSLFNDKRFEAADEAMTAMLQTKRSAEKMATEVSKLEQKIIKRGLGQRLGRLLFEATNIFTGGVLRGVTDAILPRGTGLKTLNAIDLEKLLQKNIAIINKLSNSNSEAEIAAGLKEIVQSSKPFFTSQSTKQIKSNVPQKPMPVKLPPQ